MKSTIDIKFQIQMASPHHRPQNLIPDNLLKGSNSDGPNQRESEMRMSGFVTMATMYTGERNRPLL